MSNSNENSPIPSPLVPRYIILDTKDVLREFSRSANLSDLDTNEILTQIFDELVNSIDPSSFSENNASVYTHRPNFELLRNKGLRKGTVLTSHGEDVATAYETLYAAIEQMLFHEYRDTVLTDRGFNYHFSQRRGDSIVLIHLSDLERPY